MRLPGDVEERGYEKVETFTHRAAQRSAWHEGWSFKKTLSPETVFPVVTALIGGVIIFFAMTRYEVARLEAETTHFNDLHSQSDAIMRKIIEETAKASAEGAYIRAQQEQLPKQMEKVFAETEHSKADSDWIRAQLSNLQASSADLISRTRVLSAGELNDIMLSVQPNVEMTETGATVDGAHWSIEPLIKNMGKTRVRASSCSVTEAKLGTYDGELLKESVDYTIETYDTGVLQPGMQLRSDCQITFSKKVTGKRIHLMLSYEFRTDEKAISVISSALKGLPLEAEIAQMGVFSTSQRYHYP